MRAPDRALNRVAATLRPPLLILALLLSPVAVCALERFTFEVEAVQGEGWSSGPLEVSAQLHPDGRLDLRATARELALPPPLSDLRAATFGCPQARWDAGGIHCAAARLDVTRAGAPGIRLRAEVALDSGNGRFSVSAKDQAVAGGRLALDLVLSPDDLRLQARFSGLPLAFLAAGTALLGKAPPVAVATGTVSGAVDVSRVGDRSRVAADLDLRDAGYSDAAGLRAGEALSGEANLTARGVGGALSGELQVKVTSGLLYEDPVLLEIQGAPLTLELEARISPDGSVDIPAFIVHDPAGARITGSARVSTAAPPMLEALDARLDRIAAGRLYQRYLKAFAGVGALSDLTLQGHVSGRLQWRAGAPVAADLLLEALDLGDAGGRFALFGLDGRLAWRDRAPAETSRVTWSGAQVYAVDLGAATLQAVFSGDRLRLLAPVVVPVLDGRLRIERLEAMELGADGQRVEVDLELEPLSLERLSNRLAWLPLAGSVSGKFPDLTYTDRRLAVNGDVQIRLFDGHATLSDLTLDDPFGVVPRLQGNATVRGIDLEILTRAFSFGSIEGRLDGEVRGLVLEGWQPLAFDAVFGTPQGDTSRHRISQRAVDNLASLGGANAVLSSTFLRIFQEFSYDRLGLRCRLQAGVCEMGGVGPADGGYYIVKGGGLPPRVDVVGYNTRVDWRTLVERLQAVASTQGPEIR